MPSLALQDLPTYGPDRCEPTTYDQASAYAQRLVRSQYENFTVVSWFLPRRLRHHFAHVYAFCRWADDLGDETGDRQRSLELLRWWQTEIDRCYDDRPRHPVFVALRRTIQEYDIPRKPFDDLVDAFIQDQTTTRYDSFDQVLDYCTRSADPVGRLVLYLCGYRDEQRQRLSDATCTALQLANFWQDVRRDILERDRVYIPADVAAKYELDIPTLVQAVKADAPAPGNNPEQHCNTGAACACANVMSPGIHALQIPYRRTLHDLCDRTQALFEKGRELWPLIDTAYRPDIQLFTLGGQAILRMIRRQRYDTLTRRPSLSKPAKITLMLRIMAEKLIHAPFAKRPQHTPANANA